MHVDGTRAPPGDSEAKISDEPSAKAGGLSRRPPASSLSSRAPKTATQRALESALVRRRRRFSEAHQAVHAAISEANTALKSNPPAAAPRRRSGWRRVLEWAGQTSEPLLFDAKWIASQNRRRRSPSFREYERKQDLHSISTHPLFSGEYYLARNPDVATTGMSPLRHYVERGWREGRDPHPYFSNDWYLFKNPEVSAAGANPLVHYLSQGWKEGRWPNPVFDPQAYLNHHPDVREAGVEPLSHYVRHGLAEDREIPFEGHGCEWRSLVRLKTRCPSLMDYLIHHPVEEGDKQAVAPARRPRGDWPPEPLSDSWLPYQFHDYLVRSQIDQELPLFSYLCSVMDRYADDQEAFVASESCSQLLTRIRSLSERRAGSFSRELDASIIIPVHNNLVDTVLCIASLLEHECDASYEIIVADDASTDATTEVIPSIGGVVKHVHQEKNLGFLLNCNAAAAQASGKTVVLLNNDTLVLPFWLDELLAPFKAMEKVGLVGSKLLNWDGTLQEAGGIFWEDGSAWNFGRGQDPLAPQFNYLKDVDYCSGAAIAVPTTTWKQVGGFDEAFTPAYCEDADLAFRLRDSGYRTLYNPASVVVHHEGRSHGRDVNSGIKAYQISNQARLLERWGEVLARDHFPNGHQVLRARDRSRSKPHLLFIDHHVPQWDRDAGSRTIYQYLQIFIDLGWQVTFWPDNLYRDPVYTHVLQGMGVEVITGREFINRFEDFLRDRADLYDVVFISRPHVSARYAAAVREYTKARIFYYGHDLHFRRMEASMALGGSVTNEEIVASRDMELDACRAADVIFYPDAEEVRLVRKMVGGKRKFLTNPVCVYDEAQIDDAIAATVRIPAVPGSRMLFVGGFNHFPNLEGIIWFAKFVMPLVLERVPDAQLDIVGSNAPSEVVELDSEHVSVLGLVSDEELEQLYGQSALAVAPLLHGAGVKGKVIEAMGLAVPVATTSVGAQGIASASELMFIGDTPEELAEAVALAIEDRAEAQRRARAAVEFIREHYGRESLMSLFDQLTRKSSKQR